MGGVLVDYLFWVETAVLDSTGPTQHISRVKTGYEHRINIENTGHFDANLIVYGEIPHRATGIIFTGRKFTWYEPVLDLKQNEITERRKDIDASAGSQGNETFRGGIENYEDRGTGTAYKPGFPNFANDTLNIS